MQNYSMRVFGNGNPRTWTDVFHSSPRLSIHWDHTVPMEDSLELTGSLGSLAI